METATLMTLDVPVGPLVVPSVNKSSGEEAKSKRWTRDEYHQLGEQGWFVDQRTELIDGEIIIFSSQSFSHYYSVIKVERLLQKAFGDNYWVRPEGPLAANNNSEPVPDVSVISGPMEQHKDFPRTLILAIEISKSTQAYDLGVKPSLYASTGTPEYWMIDIVARVVRVFRDPVVDPLQKFGYRYNSVAVLSDSQVVSPLGAPGVMLTVGELLPPID